MRKSFGPKPWVFPMPVLVIGTYNDDGTPNAMTAAWGMICDFDQVMLCLARDHRTVDNILARKAFTVSVANADNMTQADFVGVVSGNKDPHKVEKTNWTVEKSAAVDAPLFLELPLTLECSFHSMDEDTECIIGRIISVSVDDSVLTEDKVDMAKLRAITYDPACSGYYVIENQIGKAFGEGFALL